MNGLVRGRGVGFSGRIRVDTGFVLDYSGFVFLGMVGGRGLACCFSLGRRVIGFTDVVPVGYPATSTSPGTAPGRSDVAAVKRAVSQAAERADYVVVAWHWNFEFTTEPSALELSEGKAAIDAGADLVIAHHPHVLQGIQRYNGGLIFYSLGDLVFDGCSGPMAETVVVKLAVNAERIEAKLIPAALAYDGTPSRARGEQADEILSRVKTYSAELGTKVRLDDGLGFVTVKR